jgi:hypothetical protein
MIWNILDFVSWDIQGNLQEKILKREIAKQPSAWPQVIAIGHVKEGD